MDISITFGLQLDNYSGNDLPGARAGHYYLGPKGLVLLLETYLGLGGHASDQEYLRIENYRQALASYLEVRPDSFFARSFLADQFGTAQELLSRRDELLLAGWDFSTTDPLPLRLQQLAAVEQNFDPTYPGYADRFVKVEEYLARGHHPIKTIQLCEPLEFIPPAFRRLLKRLEQGQVVLHPYSERAEATSGTAATDLGAFQAALFAQSAPPPLRGDGSLLLLEGPSASDLAGFLAQLFRDNPETSPTLLIPERSRLLEDAFIQEGLPGMGLESASLARPVLQILKLAPAFLWNPINPYKILEFVNLALKPLDDDLANAIAGQLAASPGLDSENWRRAVARAFDQIETRYPGDTARLASARDQYQFWFRRRRFPQDGPIPKGEVIELFRYLQTWAFDLYDPENQKNSSLLVLSEQAKRIWEIMEALPEQQLTQLEVEQIVRTIYEPSPIVLHQEEQGRLNHLHALGACIAPMEELVWWNFIQTEPVHFFSRWYTMEREYLQQREITLESPEEENQRRLWFRKRPIRFAQKRLLLVVPQRVLGEPTISHPLLGDLEAAFGDLSPIRWRMEDGKSIPGFEGKVPELAELPRRPLHRPQPFAQVGLQDWLNQRRGESFTSLESLFYYPYQWAFRYQLRLRKSSILSVVPDETLMGKLAHRMFELLFQHPVADWDQNRLERWIEEQFPDLLAREGAVLLLYGREPERISFLNRLKFSAWSLITLLQANNWSVESSEKELEGTFGQVPMRGIADLILTRGQECAILDLKWRGLRRRSEMIRNEEDLQLILYSLLHTQEPAGAHTAYFIIRDGRMIARDNAAFQEVQSIQPDADRKTVNQGILQRMLATYRWRMEQMEAGKIEIRCTETLEDLEDIYVDEGLPWQELLEMRANDSFYDDYRTLIGL
jgi:hypothetical protein